VLLRSVGFWLYKLQCKWSLLCLRLAWALAYL
jgi:hypothetical protein